MNTSPKTILIIIIAGFASALCVITSFGVGASPLILIAAFPIYVAALSQGTAVGMGASILAIMIAATAIGIEAGIAIGIAFTIPASIIGHQANLAQDNNGQVEWYPLSNLFFNLAAILSLGIGTLAILSGLDTTILAEQLTVAMQKAFEESASPPPVDAEELKNIIEHTVQIAPFVMGGLWLIVHTTNLHIAAWVCRLSDMMPRPKDDIRLQANLPKIAIIVMLVSLVVMFVSGGMIETVSMIVSGVFVMAFTLIGIASIHNKLRNTAAGGAILFVFYLLILTTYPLFHLLSINGIIKVLNQPNTNSNPPHSAE